MEKICSGNYTSRLFAKQPRRPSSKPALSFGVSARRAFLKAALLAGLGLPLVDDALGDESPAANERPREGDLFVFAEGEHKGNEVKPGDLPLGGPQVLAWPKDPKSGVVRDGSRLNQVLLLRLDRRVLTTRRGLMRRRAPSRTRRSAPMRSARLTAG